MPAAEYSDTDSEVEFFVKPILKVESVPLQEGFKNASTQTDNCDVKSKINFLQTIITVSLAVFACGGIPVTNNSEFLSALYKHVPGSFEILSAFYKPFPGHYEVKQLEMEMVKLGKEFSEISEENLFRLSSSVDWVLSKEEPRHPSSLIVLLPSDPDSAKISVLKELVQNYAVMVNRIFEKMLKTSNVAPFHMDQSYFDRVGGRLAMVNDDLKKYFELGGRSVVVRDIDKIKSDKELMVFHALCDDTMAVEKRAVVIFEVAVPDSIKSNVLWNEEKSNEIAYKTLDTIWEGVLSSNFRAPLIARVLRESILTEMK